MSYEPCFQDEYSRHVYWLNCSSPNIKPRKDFDRIDKNVRRMMRKAFEYFDKGIENDLRHHGWTEADRKNCYTFKDVPFRLYGFFVPSGNRLDCFICIFTTKKSDYTDPEVFKRLNRFRLDEKVQKIIADCRGAQK